MTDNSTDISPELVERMVAHIQHMAETCADRPSIRGRARADWDELHAIAALLPKPVDPDLIEAREVGASCCDGRQPWLFIMQPEAWRAGSNDDTHKMQLVLAAIKRGRELAIGGAK